MTVIFTFPGGDQYNKNKQITQIKLQEEKLGNEVSVYEGNLDLLDENLESQKASKYVILHEETNLSKFENIVKSEYSHLSEKIEVIPELFFRIKEADSGVQPATPPNPTPSTNFTAITYNQQGDDLRIKTIVLLPVKLPFETSDFTSNRIQPPNQTFLILTDPTYGLWFPFLEEIVKYLPGVEEIFKNAESKNIPTKDVLAMEKEFPTLNIVGDKNAILTKIKSSAEQMKPIGLSTFELAKKITEDVEKTSIKLNQDQITKFSNDNPQILNVVAGIMTNVKGSTSWAPGTSISGTNRFERQQSIGSKVVQFLGVDRDAQTAAEGLRKGGFGLVVDAAEAIIKHNKEKEVQTEKETKRGNQAKAFLSHPDCEKLFKSLFHNFGPKYFVEKVES